MLYFRNSDDENENRKEVGVRAGSRHDCVSISSPFASVPVYLQGYLMVLSKIRNSTNFLPMTHCHDFFLITIRFRPMFLTVTRKLKDLRYFF